MRRKRLARGKKKKEIEIRDRTGERQRKSQTTERKGTLRVVSPERGKRIRGAGV
jgi:hypothetical protein